MQTAAKVFISWSGDQTRELGLALKLFLDEAFAGHLSTFLSDADIAPGERFLSAIAGNLGAADMGILLVTRSNQRAPWLLFEAGALAGKTDRGSVIPILVDLDRSELISPLDQFQNVLGTSEADFGKLWKQLRITAGGMPSERALGLLIEDGWPLLEQAVALSASTADDAPTPRRDSQDLLEEIHLAVSSLVRRDQAPSGWTAPPSVNYARSSRVRDNGDMNLPPGQRILHTEFGPGVVDSVTGEGAKAVAHVRFDSVGPKKLLIKIAPIELDD
ncbi:MAG: toll/interleukin-1 receptor domain-containing protein [Microbacterium enclense]